MTDDRPADDGRNSWLFLAAAACVFLAAFPAFGADPAAAPTATTGPAAAGPDSEPTPAEVAALVKQLGHDRYAVRQAAQKELIRRACPEIYEQVRQAAASQDPEVALRSQEILQAMGPQASDWAGRKVRQGMLWQRELKGGLCWPIVPAGKVVCLREEDGTTRGLDVRTGKDLWTAPRAAGAMATSGSRVVLIDNDRRLQVLDLATGSPLSGFQPESNAGFARMAVVGGTIYASRPQVSVPAGAPGSAAGQAEESDNSNGSYTFTSGPAVKSALMALDAASGKCKWQFVLGRKLLQDPIVADGVVYALTAGEITAIDAAEGVRKWANSDSIVRGYGGDSLRCLWAGDGWLGVLAGPRTIGLDAASGKVMWRRCQSVTSAMVAGAGDRPTLTDGVLLTVCNGTFNAHDLLRGRLRWSYRPELPDKSKAQPTAAAKAKVNEEWALVRGGGVNGVRGVAAGGGVGDGAYSYNVCGSTPPAALAQLSPPTVINDVLLFTSPQGLQAVKVMDWTVLWRLAEKDLLPYRPIPADGVLYFAARAGGGPYGGQGAVILYALKLSCNG